MGRYYTGNHFTGKFGFGVQSSDDPEIFGMEEQEPTSIWYELDESVDSVNHIRKVLDEQYDYIGVPKEERKYELGSNEAISDYVMSIDKYVFVAKKRKEEKEIPYHMGKENCALYGIDEKDYNDYGLYPKKPNSVLASCRIYLGLCIMLDLRKEGYCRLEAEL